MADTDPAADVTAQLVVTVKPDGNGLQLVSLASSGEYSGPVIDNRFYSIGTPPPGDLPAPQFWGVLLGMIGHYMTAPEGDDT